MGDKGLRQVDENRVSQRTLFLFFLIVALAVSLRFYGLGRESLWTDELYTWVKSSHENPFKVAESVKPTVNSPGFMVILHFVIKYLGDSEELLRLPSAVAGVLAVYAIFLLGRRFYSTREGLISALLAALSWPALYYSQEARPYSFLFLFSILTTHFWYEMISLMIKGGLLRYSTVLWYILSASFCCYLHYYGVLLVAIQGLGLILILLYRFRMRGLWLAARIYIPILILYGPWLPVFFEKLFHGRIRWADPPTMRNVPNFLEFIFGSRVFRNWIILPLIIFFMVAISQLFRRSKSGAGKGDTALDPTLLLFIWMALPFILAYLKSILSTPVLVNRYLIVSLAPALILSARLINLIPPRRYSPAMASVIVGSFMLANLFWTGDFYSRPHKEQYRESVKFIVDRECCYGKSLIIGYVYDKKWLDYYFKMLDSSRRADLMARGKKDLPAIKSLIEKRGPDYLWVINVHFEPDEKSLQYYEKRFTLVEQKDFLRASVRLYETGGHGIEGGEAP